jgi:hypothetical protein
MDHQTWRFVDDQEGVVFIDDLQHYGFRGRPSRAGWGDL